MNKSNRSSPLRAPLLSLSSSFSPLPLRSFFFYLSVYLISISFPILCISYKSPTICTHTRAHVTSATYARKNCIPDSSTPRPTSPTSPLIRKTIFCFRPGTACVHTTRASAVVANVVPEDPVRARQSRLEGKFTDSLCSFNYLRPNIKTQLSKYNATAKSYLRACQKSGIFKSNQKRYLCSRSDSKTWPELAMRVSEKRKKNRKVFDTWDKCLRWWMFVEVAGKQCDLLVDICMLDFPHTCVRDVRDTPLETISGSFASNALGRYFTSVG